MTFLLELLCQLQCRGDQVRASCDECKVWHWIIEYSRPAALPPAQATVTNSSEEAVDAVWR